MQLKSMKLSPKESKEMIKPQSSNAPRYPYGLHLSFDKECLDKLGLSKLPKVGNSVTVMARAKVESVSERDSAGDGKRRSLELQITDIGFEMAKSKIGDLLYGKEDAE